MEGLWGGAGDTWIFQYGEEKAERQPPCSLHLSEEEKQREVPVSSLWLPMSEQVGMAHSCRQTEY